MCTAHFFGNNRIELDTSKRQNRVCANLIHSVTVETTNNTNSWDRIGHVSHILLTALLRMFSHYESLC